MKTEEIVKIPVLSILDKLGIKYSRKGAGEYSIHDGEGKTSGRSANEHKNIVWDFSKDRGQGDTFGFVKQILKLDDKETFTWFEENFGIVGEKQKQPIRFLWQGLDELKQDQIDYLQERGVDYNKIKGAVKNYRNGIGCLVYKNGVPKGLRARTLNKDGIRFFSATGYEGDGIYMYELDETKDYIIVVEGLIDFLTLRQFETNVVGLCTALVGYDDIKQLGDKYRIIMCPDNDEAGYKGLEQMKGYPYSLFNVGKYGDYKDIGDFYKDSPSSEIIGAILESATEILPINTTFDGLDIILKAMNEKGQLGIDGPLDDVYKKCSGVIKGKVYTIGAYSNIGKSKLAYFHTQYFLKQGLRVLFINLEVSSEFCLAEIVNSYYGITWQDQWSGYNRDRAKFRNLIIRDDLFELSDILKTIEQEKPDICIIDFVQNIQVKGTKGYEKNSEIAIGIQRTAIRTGTTIYSLSQVANSTAKDIQGGLDTIISLKGAGEYTASSDIIFILKRGDEEDQLELVIEKNKFGRNKLEFKLKVDYQRNQFVCIKPFEKPF